MPPLEALYHLIFDPVAVRSATVPALQKLCDEVPVGAAVVVTVNVAVDDVADNAGLHCDTTHE